jgi:hypothetical protein
MVPISREHQSPNSGDILRQKAPKAENELPIGLCLWRLAGAMKCKTVSLGNADMKPLGIDRASKSRSLRALEGAGLIELARGRGRFPKVTLRETPAPQPDQRALHLRRFWF